MPLCWIDYRATRIYVSKIDITIPFKQIIPLVKLFPIAIFLICKDRKGLGRRLKESTLCKKKEKNIDIPNKYNSVQCSKEESFDLNT